MKKQIQVTFGYGQVGKAIHKIVGGTWQDKENGTWDGHAMDIAHICIPYSDDFERFVAFIKDEAKLVIVHSSVPVGTCDKLGVVHSPVTGVHPHLEQGIRTFVKYFGGKNAQKASRVFSRHGIKTKSYKQAKTTEALKLWSTTQYGRMIMLEKEIHAWCKKHKVDFNAVYTHANRTYNEGYTKLDMPHVVRPILKHIEGPIGGHCVQQNAQLLKVKL